MTNEIDGWKCTKLGPLELLRKHLPLELAEALESGKPCKIENLTDNDKLYLTELINLLNTDDNGAEL